MNAILPNLELVILAAGKGSRLEKDATNPDNFDKTRQLGLETGLQKCLQPLNGKPLVEYAIDLADQLGIKPLVVVGHMGDKFKQLFGNKARWVWQQELLGTGDAVKTALKHIDPKATDMFVIPGDHGFIYTPDAVEEITKFHRDHSFDITVVAFEVDDPSTYGRLITGDQGRLLAIVEEADLAPDQQKVNLINSATMCLSLQHLQRLVDKIQPNPKKGEYYLTDIIAFANEEGLKVGYYTPNVPFSHGINTLDQFVSAAYTFKSSR